MLLTTAILDQTLALQETAAAKATTSNTPPPPRTCSHTNHAQPVAQTWT